MRSGLDPKKMNVSRLLELNDRFLPRDAKLSCRRVSVHPFFRCHKPALYQNG